MKTHELASQLEAAVKLLRSLPDTEINSVVAALISLTSSSAVGVIKNKEPVLAPLLDEVVTRLAGMNPGEIERYLDSPTESGLLTPANLMQLANKLGISASKRQSRSALVNLIVRHFEAGQMELMIRGTRKDDSKIHEGN